MTNYTTFLGLYKPDKAEGLKLKALLKTLKRLTAKSVSRLAMARQLMKI